MGKGVLIGLDVCDDFVVVLVPFVGYWRYIFWLLVWWFVCGRFVVLFGFECMV